MKVPMLVRLSLGILIYHCSAIYITNSELYTSVAELERWDEIKQRISNMIDESLEDQTRKLYRLYELKKIYEKSIGPFQSPDSTHHPHDRVSHHAESIIHPVKAFVVLNRMVDFIEDIEDVLNDAECEVHMEDLFGETISGLGVPTRADVIGTGQALLRLQQFYQLDIEDVISGNINQQNSNNTSSSPLMSGRDCFELGRIAYDNEDFSASIPWFQKALELLNYKSDFLDRSSNFSSSTYGDLVNEVLEYKAFAHYSIGDIPSTVSLTSLWLRGDPDNERAISNYEYFSELISYEKIQSKPEAAKKESSRQFSKNDDRNSANEHHDYKYIHGTKFNAKNYVYTKDEVVRRLCLGRTADNENYQKIPSKLACYRKWFNKNHFLLPEMKVEVVSLNPYIIRLHEILSNGEVQEIREKAMKNLRRSTIQTSSGLKTTDFRIAKTAWLTSDINPLIGTLEDRLSRSLGISLDGSEELQVVNYGFGGFYGPHLDSARGLEGEKDPKKIPCQLERSDRLATILIYLNEVEAGGSTVFPKLNLTIEPMARSAVVWFNIKPNGYSDDRTLHTGCPILLGSKWIATKWPRESGNTFSKPCGPTIDDSWPV